MKNLLQRTFTGSVYVLAIIASLLIHKVFFGIVFLSLGFLALREFKNLSQQKGKGQIILLSLIFITNFIFFFLRADGIIKTPSAVPLLISLIGLFLFHLFSAKKDNISALQENALGILYIIIPFVITPLLVFQEQRFFGNNLLWMFILIWINDVMAYVTGSLTGKNKLFERISPNKSWEGFFGGLIFSGITGFLIAYFTTENSFLFWISYSLLVAVFSSVGDLFESMLKRQAGVKDSGNLLPGHGGILDRIDSVLFAIPITYIFFNIFV